MHATAVSVPANPSAARLTGALRLTCVAIALVALPACSWMPWRHSSSAKEGQVHSCNKPQDYQQAQSNPPLHMPVGLEAPATRGALRIPELREPEVPRKLTDPCLEEPPKFSSTARLLPPPMDKKTRKALEKQEKEREKQRLAEEKRKREEEKRKRAAEKAAKKAAREAAKKAKANNTSTTPPAAPTPPPAESTASAGAAPASQDSASSPPPPKP
jgi:hypothetical protein